MDTVQENVCCKAMHQTILNIQQYQLRKGLNLKYASKQDVISVQTLMESFTKAAYHPLAIWHYGKLGGGNW